MTMQLYLYDANKYVIILKQPQKIKLFAIRRVTYVLEYVMDCIYCTLLHVNSFKLCLYNQ